MSTEAYTQPRPSVLATRTALSNTPTHPSSGDTSPTTAPPTLQRKPTNNYEEARAAAAANQTQGEGATSPNATKEDLKRWSHEGLFGKSEKGGAGYYSTSG
ncbi:hypothetical protein PRZ48_004101 [Zasmidium cellare]|uniref:Uncharacterized protein n=1 Tax=Zasmidium cellare TaxID=395010 RepID=A0ABR0EYH0_ZASCE|nr:hypothetical protein PRZ48_004101 [Zasmidium cellare]